MVNNARREFIQSSMKSLGLLGLSPLISSSIIHMIQRTAYAAQTTNTKKYIYFSLDGAPPRWLFDLPLQPYGAGSTFANMTITPGGFGNRLVVNSGKTEVRVANWNSGIRDKNNQVLHLPPVWGSNPSGGGFSHCLSNALFVRGVDMEIDNHFVSRYRNQAPSLGGVTIAGSLAENVTSPIPAIVGGDIGTAFKAAKPVAPVVVTNVTSASSNPVSRTLNYFSGSPPVDTAAVSQSLSEFDKYALEKGVPAHGLKLAKEKADFLIKNGVESFKNQWGPVFDKYNQKVSQAMSRTNTSQFMPNATLPRGDSSNPQIRYDDGSVVRSQLGDLRDLITPQTTVANLAASFATIEILIKNDLTQVATYSLNSNLSNLDPSGDRFSIPHDQHNVGLVVSTLGTSFYYRSVLNCLEELIRTLKSTGHFNQTLIHFGSEFNRSPRADGSGSDHGPSGSSALFISGLIDGTGVIGNIRATSSDQRYPGSWGVAATHSSTLGDNRPIMVKDLAYAATNILGVNEVTTNQKFILDVVGGKFVGKGETRNI